MPAGVTIDFGDFSIEADARVDGEVRVLIPAQAVRLAPLTQSEGLEARVKAVRQRSAAVRVELEIGSCLLQAEIAGVGAEECGLQCGSSVSAMISPANVHILGNLT